jgi:hypothetical protein
MPKILVNGRVYNNPDEMPPDVRDTYLKTLEVLHDSDGNGIPDFLEGKPLQNVNDGTVSVNVRSGTQVIVGDKVYTNLDELPPDVRLKYDQAVERLGPLMSDTNGNGIPDILEGKAGGISAQQEITPSVPMKVSPTIRQEPPPSVIREESTNFGAIALVLLVILVLLGMVGIGAYIFMTMVK